MENLNVFANEDNQVNGERPPPRVCPRCNSDNTKFCYYNNYSVSQPRYSCKNCRRFWTHGGALRNVPVGGSCRKAKRVRVDQSPVSRMVSAEIQQVNHQPFSYVQENNEFVGSFGASSAAAVGNRFVSLSDIHGGMVTNVPPSRSFRPNHRLEYHDGSFEQDYYDLGPNDLIGNPMMNQPIGGYVDNHNGYRMNQVDQHKWNHQSFNNAMKMNHNASTSGNRGSDMNMNSGNNKFRYNSLIKHPRHLEKHGP